MMFTATWFAGDVAISSEHAGSFAAARDIARSRMPAHKVRSAATHFEVRSEDGALMVDSRADIGAASPPQPTLATRLVTRWTMPNSSPT